MKFQLERIALFSDAVFAIAITLMMIEVKPPHLEHGTSFGMALIKLLQLIPTFIGTILSFFMIGIFWKRHHQLMKYMAAYNEKVIMLNITLLLTIAFIPFSTAFVFENIEAHTALPLLIYNLNYIMASFLNFLLFKYILNPANNLRVSDFDQDVRIISREIVFPVFVYVLVIILAFVEPNFASIGYAAFALEKYWVRRTGTLVKV
ncbi:MAG: TMEM175 family protein [Bacteroidia bacterium]|jgi:uncharacterized membrane protein